MMTNVFHVGSWKNVIKATDECACGHARGEHYPSEAQLAVKPNGSRPVMECHGDECSCSGYEAPEED